MTAAAPLWGCASNDMMRRCNIAAPATAPGSGDSSEFQQQLRRHMRRMGPYMLLLLITIPICFHIDIGYYLNSLYGSNTEPERNAVAEDDIESCLRPRSYTKPSQKTSYDSWWRTKPTRDDRDMVKKSSLIPPCKIITTLLIHISCYIRSQN